MADEVDSLEAPASDDRILRAWAKVRSSLHQSGHRFNSRCAEQHYAGVNADPEEILEYFVTMYERTVAMAVKTVTDHESAIGCWHRAHSTLPRSAPTSAQSPARAAHVQPSTRVRAAPLQTRTGRLRKTDCWSSSLSFVAGIGKQEW
jgi:hypothetical protein